MAEHRATVASGKGVGVGMTDMEISEVTEIFCILIVVWVTHLYAVSTFIEFCAFHGDC